MDVQVNLILSAGASPNLTDAHSKTALHRAAENGHSKVVELLSPVSDCDMQVCAAGGSA